MATDHRIVARGDLSVRARTDKSPRATEGTTDMFEVTINGQPHSLPQTLSLAELLQRLGYASPRVAVEVNREVVPRPRHAEHLLRAGDAVEIVTLVGGGSPEAGGTADKPLRIGTFTFRSRLITG